MSKEEVKQIAIDGAKLLKELAQEDGGNYIFEYSPESFTGTEVDYALDVCNAVLKVWEPGEDFKPIINLPSTVELSMPHVYASQIEYMCKHLYKRENVIVSLHPHNDRGCGISDAELGILAGADRIEGTLFGNGERTGNVDLVTVAMNMVTHGVDSGLDFSNIMKIREAYERFTNMKVHERTPYGGDLVFTAFSGSHQDAISKGMNYRAEGKTGARWDIPYIPIDPSDIGREYESDVIRINSTSGKGGVAFVLKQQFGFSLPAAMKEEVGYLMKGVSDRKHKELKPDEIFSVFEDVYVTSRPVFDATAIHYKQLGNGGIEASVSFKDKSGEQNVVTVGNGRLDSVSNAIKLYLGVDYELTGYEEHAISKTSSSKAASYVSVVSEGKTYWGVGVDEDIIKASNAALVSCVNKVASDQHINRAREERLVEILTYIQRNYQDVSLDSMAEEFHLSRPYLSKYIKEKTGETFQDVLRIEKLKRAKTLLKDTGKTIENIALEVGYENVEHFNRMFKKTYGVTPVQYRKQ
jgi:2-isopropylmalate synthase